MSELERAVELVRDSISYTRGSIEDNARHRHEDLNTSLRLVLKELSEIRSLLVNIMWIAAAGIGSLLWIFKPWR